MRRFDLLPIAVCQLSKFQLTHRYREQAPSHIVRGSQATPTQVARGQPMRAARRRLALTTKR